LRNSHVDSADDLGAVASLVKRDGWPPFDSEVLKVVRVAEAFRIDCIPWFTYGLNRNDLIAADEVDGVLAIRSVVSPSGHGTFRIRLDPAKIRVGSTSSVDPEFIAFTSYLGRLNCTFEISDETLQSIDVPPRENTDVRAAVADLLTLYAETGWYLGRRLAPRKMMGALIEH
jgi:hypothetical protein